MNELKSYSEIIPCRYLWFNLNWLVLKPYVLVRQGTTTQD